MKAAAAKIVAKHQAMDPARVSEERKKRNYADFWMPSGINEPFRVVLSQLRDR